jgi:hypothetical protein
MSIQLNKKFSLVKIKDDEFETVFKINHEKDWTLPGYNYCGPGTRELKAKPISLLDELCKEHDEAYINAKNIYDIKVADRLFIKKLKLNYTNFNKREKIFSKFIIIIFRLKNL